MYWNGGSSSSRNKIQKLWVLIKYRQKVGQWYAASNKDSGNNSQWPNVIGWLKIANVERKKNRSLLQNVLEKLPVNNFASWHKVICVNFTSILRIVEKKDKLYILINVLIFIPPQLFSLHSVLLSNYANQNPLLIHATSFNIIIDSSNLAIICIPSRSNLTS